MHILSIVKEKLEEPVVKTVLKKDEEDDDDSGLSHSSISSNYANQCQIPTHAKKNCCFHTVYHIVSHNAFNAAFMCFTVGNTVVLAIDRANVSDTE